MSADNGPRISEIERLKKKTNIKATRRIKKNNRMEFMIALITKKMTTASNSTDTTGCDTKAEMSILKRKYRNYIIISAVKNNYFFLLLLLSVYLR